MENLFKHKLARLFRLCKTKNLTSDVVIDDFTPHHFHHLRNSSSSPSLNNDQNRNFHPLIELFSPKRHRSLTSFPSLCKPKFPQTPRSTPNGQKCPPTSPIMTILPPHPKKHKKHPKKKKKKMMMTRHHIRRLDFDDFPELEYKGLFSSDDDDTFYSSRTFSVSPSSASRDSLEAVEDSFAVVKRSSDPYGDFRASMLEMILEKQMFGVKDLEKLLGCFLSLNTQNHHEIIIDVFTEICEALFSAFTI